MRTSFSRYVGVPLGLALAACTLDSTNPTGAGGAAASSGSATTTSTSDGASSSISAGGASTTSGSSDASSSSGSSPDASSSVASSSSGGPEPTVPPCYATKDDFNGYADLDATFIALGQDAGPWQEDAMTKANVSLVPGGRIRTEYGGGFGAFLELKTAQALGGTCAITVRMVSRTGGDSTLGIWDKVQNYTELECREGNGQCEPLRAFGVSGGNVALVNGGLYLGIVVKGDRLFAFYSGDGASWTLVPNLPANGADGSQVLDQPVIAYFGQNPNNAESVWDDFGIHGIPESLVP